MLVTLGCQIQSYQQMKDRGFKIVLETGELGAEQVLGLHELYNKSAWASIGENPVSFVDIKEDLPKALQNVPKGKKSHSQRLRGVLYKIREKENSKASFETYYEIKMEKIIEHYKKELE